MDDCQLGVPAEGRELLLPRCSRERLAASPQPRQLLLLRRMRRRRQVCTTCHTDFDYNGGLATLTAVADLPPFPLSFMSAWCPSYCVKFPWQVQRS